METVHKLLSVIGNLLELVNVHIIEGEHNLKEEVTDAIAEVHGAATEMVEEVKAAVEGIGKSDQASTTDTAAPAQDQPATVVTDPVTEPVSAPASSAPVDPAPADAASATSAPAEAAPAEAAPATPAR